MAMTNRERALRRVRKLMRLHKGRNATQAESANAIEKARAILDQYNLTISDLGADHDFTATEKIARSGTYDKTIDRWEGLLAASIAVLYDCVLIKYGKGHLSFIGTGLDVEIAEEIYNQAREDVLAMESTFLARHVMGEVNGESLREAYCDGMSEAIRERIAVIVNLRVKNAVYESSTALVPLKSEAIQEYLEHKMEERKAKGLDQEPPELPPEPPPREVNVSEFLMRQIAFSYGQRDAMHLALGRKVDGESSGSSDPV